MMLGGLDENEKKIKNAMLAAGADNSFVKGWFKVYEKTKKNSTSVAGRYYRVKEELTKLLGDLEDLEQMIIGYNELTEDEKMWIKFAKANGKKYTITDEGIRLG